MRTTHTEAAADQTAADAVARTRAVIDAYLDALVGGGDYGAHLAEDATLTAMETGEVSRGRAAVVGLIDFLHRRAFAASPVVRSVTVDAGRAALEADFAGTHVGEFAGVAPTGKAVRVPYAVAYDLAGDRIAALRLYLPTDALLRQLRDA